MKRIFKKFKIKINFRVKIILAFVGLTFLAIFLTQYVSKFFVTKIITRELMKSIGNIPELIRDTQSSIKFDDELVLASKIVALKKNPNIISIFIIDAENKIINSSRTDEEAYQVGKKIEFNINDFEKKGENYIQETKDLIVLAKDGEVKLSDSKKDFYVIITLSKKQIHETIRSLNIKFLFVGLGIIAYSIGIALPFSKLISKKAIIVSEAARRIGGGDLDFKLKIKSRLIDELDDLAEDINKMTIGLKDAEGVKLKNEAFKKEMAIAETIQQTLLPKKTPEYERFSLASFYKSAKEVGGDYFDWIEVDDKHLGIVVADVSGKGIGGAFVMAITRSILRSQAIGNLDADEVFRKTNAILKPDIKRGMFVTAWYGILNTETGVLKFTNAGHNPVYIYHPNGGGLESIKLKGISLGLAKPKMFDRVCELKEVKFEPGMFLFQYTDGVTEAYDTGENLYGEERLEKILVSNKEKTAQEILENVKTDVFNFTRGAEQSDDILMVTLKMNK